MRDEISKKLGYSIGKWKCNYLETYVVDKDSRTKVEEKDLDPMNVISVVEEENNRVINICRSAHDILSNKNSFNWKKDSKLLSYSKSMLEHLIMLQLVFEEYNIGNNGSLLFTKDFLETITDRKWEEIKKIYTELNYEN
jgi:hypothetical protein